MCVMLHYKMSIDVSFAIEFNSLFLCKTSETYNFGLFLITTVHDNKEVLQVLQILWDFHLFGLIVVCFLYPLLYSQCYHYNKKL